MQGAISFVTVFLILCPLDPGVRIFAIILILCSIATLGASYFEGELLVRVKRAAHLRNADNPDRSDPFVKVTAYEEDGTTVEKSTSVKSGAGAEATWDEALEFGHGKWEYFQFHAFDSDSGWTRDGDDSISDVYRVTIDRYFRFSEQCVGGCPGGQNSQDFYYTYSVY